MYCLKIIKTGPVYPCKKRSLTSFVALVSFKNLYKLLLHKVGMFCIKIDKTCIKAWHNDSYSNRTVLINIFSASEWLPFQMANERHVIKRKQTRKNVCGLCLNANTCKSVKFARILCASLMYDKSESSKLLLNLASIAQSQTTLRRM